MRGNEEGDRPRLAFEVAADHVTERSTVDATKNLIFGNHTCVNIGGAGEALCPASKTTCFH